jgi:hypothetical protein
MVVARVKGDDFSRSATLATMPFGRYIAWAHKCYMMSFYLSTCSSTMQHAIYTAVDAEIRLPELSEEGMGSFTKADAVALGHQGA